MTRRIRVGSPVRGREVLDLAEATEIPKTNRMGGAHQSLQGTESNRSRAT